MNDKLEKILNSPYFAPTVVGVIGFGSGLGVGLFLGKKRALGDLEFYEIPGTVESYSEEDTEVLFVVDDKTKEAPVRPEPVVIDEEVAVQKGILTVDSLAALRPSMVNDDEVIEIEEVAEVEIIEETVVVTSDGPEIEWSWEQELEQRRPTEPYILHKEEFYANEKNFQQVSLTYYALDGELVDQDGVPVYNYSSVTGELNFGHGSGQDNVVYIRNEELKSEYEVTKLEESYELEVLGMETEAQAERADLQHSKILRFRQE